MEEMTFTTCGSICTKSCLNSYSRLPDGHYWHTFPPCLMKKHNGIRKMPGKTRRIRRKSEGLTTWKQPSKLQMKRSRGLNFGVTLKTWRSKATLKVQWTSLKAGTGKSGLDWTTV